MDDLFEQNIEKPSHFVSAEPPTPVKRTSKKLYPWSYFHGWAYTVVRAHWQAFGVELREFMKNKAPFTAYAISVPPRYDFHEGDVFHHQSDGSYIQVVAVNDTHVEAHYGLVGREDINHAGFVLPPAMLEQWLRTGEMPPTTFAITAGMSKSVTFRYRLPT